MQRHVARATAVSPWIASGWTLLRWFSMLLFGLAALLCLGWPRAHAMGQAQAPPAPAQAAPAASAAKPVAEEARGKEAGDHGLNMGIKVHGHWVIEVRNPNGNLARHVEFENSLVGSGGLVLAGLLGGTWSVSPQTWTVWISGTMGFNGTNGPCSNGQSCFIVSPTSCTSACAPNEFNNLSITTPGNGTTLSLTGTATAANSSAIDMVGTIVRTCGNTVAPGSCTLNSSNAGYPFTQATNFPGSPVNVTAGQTINVSVTISFQ